jgi:GTP cyclohydrolase I
MSNDIRIKKGLDINLVGVAEKTKESAIISNFCTIRPEDFHSVIPKLVAKVGSKLKAGETVFYDKANEAIKFVSPVSGEVIEITRGEKRKILAIKIQADKEQHYKDFGRFNLDTADGNTVKAHLLASGCWPFIKQRPYDVVANPKNKPKVALFDNKYQYHQMLVEKNITFYSNCEHHFVPIIGKAHIAYKSSGKVIGLSKLNRIVQYYAKRPQVQERLTNQIANELKTVLETEDVAVIIDAKHLCVSSRGVQDDTSSTVTTYYGGEFNTAAKISELQNYLNN